MLRGCWDLGVYKIHIQLTKPMYGDSWGWRTLSEHHARATDLNYGKRGEPRLVIFPVKGVELQPPIADSGITRSGKRHLLGASVNTSQATEFMWVIWTESIMTASKQLLRYTTTSFLIYLESIPQHSQSGKSGPQEQPPQQAAGGKQPPHHQEGRR